MVELAAVYYFYEWRALGLAGGYPDGGGVFDAHALAECVVGFDFRSQFALWVEGHGELDFVRGGEAFRELAQQFERCDGRLVGEDLIAVVVADTLARTVVSPAELPVGAMTAIAGAPLFLYLMRRRLA